MNTNYTYKFEQTGLGSLELTIKESHRSYYKPTNLEGLHFSVKFLGKHDIDTPPFCFFEWQRIHYLYVIEENTSFIPPFEIRVNNRTLNKSGARGSCHFLSGDFSFNDEVGETIIEIRDAVDRLILKIETEVYPQKMDYKSDYEAMMSDISSIIYNLTYDILKDTFKRSRIRIKGQATQNEWWNILDALFEQLMINLEVIKRQPKHDIRLIEKVLPIEKVKVASKKSVSWFIQNNKYSNNVQRGISVTPKASYTHALSKRKQVSYDTYENRFVTWGIKNVIEQLRFYKRDLEQNKTAKDYSTIVNKVKEYQGRLQGLMHSSPFNEVGSFEKRASFSTSLTRGAGYKDFMHIYFMLSRGLELMKDDIFKIEQKNISTLYEYWCFLKLLQILKELNASEIEYQSLIKFSSNRYRVLLREGNESKVTFKKVETGELTSIYFNKSFEKDDKKVFTYNQKPDYSIEFTRHGFDKPFWYLFDAKYRFDEKNTEENNQYNVPQDAIGQLHRYRDAILHSEPISYSYRTAIKNLGGIILYPFPLSEKDFEHNKYYKSIGHINIGALPFLPSKTTLVRTFLDELINKSMPDSYFEQLVEMDRSEYNGRRDRWKECVTIGTIPKDFQAERIEFINNKLVYHVPFVRDINSQLFSTKKLLLCQAGTNEAILFDVSRWEILTDKELTSMGTTWKHRECKYVVFHIKRSQTLRMPSKIAPRKFRYTTLEGLERFMKDPVSDAGCFYLTSPSAGRLYDELRHMNIKFKLKWANNDNDPSLVEFHLPEKKLSIYSSDNYNELHFYCNNSSLSLTKVLELVF